MLVIIIRIVIIERALIITAGAVLVIITRIIIIIERALIIIVRTVLVIIIRIIIIKRILVALEYKKGSKDRYYRLY